MTTRTLTTAEQFFALPDDDQRHDLLEGEVWSMSLAGRKHGRVANRVSFLLTSHVEERGLGEVAAAETGFVLRRDPDTVLGPDAAFVRADRVPAEAEGHWPIAPDLAVEIVSPGDRAAGVARKVRAYLDAGVPLVWVLYPEREQVVVHEPGRLPRTFTNDQTLDGGTVLPDFRCPVRALWR